MKAFVSWSGGKDCMLALHRFLKEADREVVCLVNMCDKSSNKSRSHGLSREMISRQAACMNLLLVQQVAGRNDYELRFKEVITRLKKDGVTAGVFGDIYLMEHRTWIERVCKEMEIEPVFPLWNADTTGLLREFVFEGFKALTVSVRTGMLPENWLGREIDESFLNELCALEGIDPCAENGEYHSFVYDGPLFGQTVRFEKGVVSEHDNHHFLEIRES